MGRGSITGSLASFFDDDSPASKPSRAPLRGKSSNDTIRPRNRHDGSGPTPIPIPTPIPTPAPAPASAAPGLVSGRAKQHTPEEEIAALRRRLGRSESARREGRSNVQDLQERFTAATTELEDAKGSLQTARDELQRVKEELEMARNELRRGKEEMEDLKGGLRDAEEALEEERLELAEVRARLSAVGGAGFEEVKRRLEVANAVLEKERRDKAVMASHLERVARGLRLDVSAYKAQLKVIAPFAEGKTTPRWLLMLQLIRAETMPLNPPPDAPLTLQTLTRSTLDATLTFSQAGAFLEEIEEPAQLERLRNSLSVKLCNDCHVPKLSTNAQSVRKSPFDEFPRLPGRLSSGMNDDVCTDCCLRTLGERLERNAFGMRSELFVGVRQTGDITTILRCLGDKELDKHATMFETSEILRAALRKHNPELPEETLSAAYEFHQELVQKGYMHSIFHPQFQNTLPDDCGRIPPFHAGTIQSIDVGPHGRIPVFMKFFKRQKTPTECVACSERAFDIDLGAISGGEETRAFGDEWMWELMLFPNKDMLPRCGHDSDFCKGCLAMHLQSQLEQLGRAGCERLACPAGECGRVFDYDEVRRLANNETFARYDQYRLLNRLSNEPGFMWCLREGCSNGQIYDTRGLVQCDYCGFRMCVGHQMAWHEGRTCEQYENQRRHGDPEYRGTRDWIHRNAKLCPSCRTAIQRSVGCDHMTCTNCRHEFCWICLGNWRGHTTCNRPAQFTGAI